ncbi:MAG: hypothetical protein ACI97N_001761 [Cognaticolwellia sp.]
MLKIFKVLGIIIGVLMVTFLVLFLMFSEPLPKGEKGIEADALAEKVLVAINKSAWDSTGVIQWTFRDSHHFLWDKKRNLVRVQWKNNEVFVVLDELTGVAFKDGKKLEGKKADKLIKKAWSFFANDSFWLNAPSKVFDEGTERRLVKLENDEEALLITYASGGVTPGDSYLWILDENGLPKSWKMWVKIIPIGGVQTTWQDWVTLETGAKIAQNHYINENINVPITNLKASKNLETFGLENDPFIVLE